MINLKKYMRFGWILLFFIFPTRSGNAVALQQMADTPWPMYQHDPQHTGRSPFLGPLHKPEVLWIEQLPDYSGSNGGIAIDKDGNLLIAIRNTLMKFDPIMRRLLWVFPYHDVSYDVPLAADDGSIYWGFGNAITRLSSSGDLIWGYSLGINFAFGSHITFGQDGNLYFNHDGLWSFRPDGEFRWYFPVDDLSQGSAAIGEDGVIYSPYVYDLCAFQPSGAIIWCNYYNHSYSYSTPAIDSQGTIYLPGFALHSIAPSGQLIWDFFPEECRDYRAYVRTGLGITPDDSIIFAVNQNETPLNSIVHKVNREGNLQWKVRLPNNGLTGVSSTIEFPLHIDREGNVIFCSMNSSCYSINPDGAILWQYTFPLEDSVNLSSLVEPVLISDGLFFVVDTNSRLYAMADPEIVPALESNIQSLTYRVVEKNPPFTTTLSITSTIAPVDYSIVVSSTGWVTPSIQSGITPSDITLMIDASSLKSGHYQTLLKIFPTGKVGKWLEIPISLEVLPFEGTLHSIFFPYSTNDNGYRVLYLSQWFTENHFASISFDGKNRVAINKQIPYQVDFVKYSPDREKVALVYLDNGEHSIRILDTRNGSTLLEIASSGMDREPAWSPDSNQIAFWSTRDDSYYGEVYRINLDGTHLTRLTNNLLRETNLFWSPKGDLIAFGTNTFTYVMKPDGSDLKQLPIAERSPIPEGWSPDGRFLLYKAMNPNLANFDLWIYDFSNGSSRLLAEKVLYYSSAAFSPNGKYVVFQAAEYTDWSDIFVVEVNTGTKTRLTNSKEKDYEPAWSSDSQWIAFTSDSDIDIIHFSGAPRYRLTKNIKMDNFPGWYP